MNQLLATAGPIALILLVYALIWCVVLTLIGRASGGVELIATALSIQHSLVHPTINYQTPDPDCDLDYVPNTAREMRVRRAISNSFGFGGHNCCLVVGGYTA